MPMFRSEAQYPFYCRVLRSCELPVIHDIRLNYNAARPRRRCQRGLKLGPSVRKDYAPCQHGQIDLNGVDEMRRCAEQIAFYHN